MFLSLLGGSSKLDILIATPGRLMDHLASTPNFTLQHLRFLVIDEADRLLNQSFQNWLTQVLAYTRPPVEPIPPSFKRKPHDTVSSAFMEACSLIDKDGEWCDFSPSIVCRGFHWQDAKSDSSPSARNSFFQRLSRATPPKLLLFLCTIPSTTLFSLPLHLHCQQVLASSLHYHHLCPKKCLLFLLPSSRSTLSILFTTLNLTWTGHWCSPRVSRALQD